jgi:predicted ATP-grasp superfamily ATP-dependent carboligase
MNPAKQCDALLTYGWCRSSYTALRSLSRLGLKVATADEHQIGMSRMSRYSASTYRYTSPFTDPEAFVADIVRLVELTGAHFLLPGHDETEILARFRDRLPEQVILPVAPVELIAQANNKAIMIEKACRLGLPVPGLFSWNTLDDLSRQMAHITAPLVVKLRRSNSAKGVFYASSGSEAVGLCQHLIDTYQLLPERYPIVQERVEGEGWGVSCLYWHGERIASFTHHRLREKTSTGGTSTLRASVCNPYLESIAFRLLDEMGWHGLAMVEFKYDPTTRQGWFIEVNPRLWGSIHLAVASGVDFPALLYRAALDGPESARGCVRQQKDGVVARWYLGDAIAAVGQIRQGRISRALKMLLPGGADTYDDLHWDDPAAFVGQAVYYLSAFLKTRSLNPEQEGMLG